MKHKSKRLMNTYVKWTFLTKLVKSNKRKCPVADEWNYNIDEAPDDDINILWLFEENGVKLVAAASKEESKTAPVPPIAFARINVP